MILQHPKTGAISSVSGPDLQVSSALFDEWTDDSRRLSFANRPSAQRFTRVGSELLETFRNEENWIFPDRLRGFSVRWTNAACGRNVTTMQTRTDVFVLWTFSLLSDLWLPLRRTRYRSWDRLLGFEGVREFHLLSRQPPGNFNFFFTLWNENM